MSRRHDRHNRDLCGPILLTALLACSFSSLTTATDLDDAGSDMFTFRFDPPDGTRAMQVLRSTREKDMGELGTQREESEVRTLVEMRRTASGYQVVASPQDFRMTRDGVEIQDPIQDLLQDVVITYVIDHGGRLIQVLGFEGFAANMRKTLAPLMSADQLATIEPLISEEALVIKELADWNGRIGDYVGMLISASGDHATGAASYTLPSGQELDYDTFTRFSEPRNCCRGRCVEIRIWFDSDAAALAKRVEQDGDGDAPPGPQGDRITDTWIAGEITRLMDPATMLICRESSTRTLRMSVEVPGFGMVPMTIVETREYLSEYE